MKISLKGKDQTSCICNLQADDEGIYHKFNVWKFNESDKPHDSNETFYSITAIINDSDKKEIDIIGRTSTLGGFILLTGISHDYHKLHEMIKVLKSDEIVKFNFFMDGFNEDMSVIVERKGNKLNFSLASEYGGDNSAVFSKKIDIHSSNLDYVGKHLMKSIEKVLKESLLKWDRQYISNGDLSMLDADVDVTIGLEKLNIHQCGQGR